MLNERRGAQSKARLAEIATPGQFLEILGLDKPDAILTLVTLNPIENLYREKVIRCSNARVRKLQLPRPELKGLQKAILALLEPHYVPPLHVHSYVRGRGHVSNSRVHVGQHFIFSIDLENFFPSISKSLVEEPLTSPLIGLHPDIALTIWRWCSFEGGLPMGAPTSPLLSNIACTQLDASLASLGRRFEGKLSRYGDDMNFSSMGLIPQFLARADHRSRNGVEVGDELANCIHQSGFRINQAKTRLRSRHESQRVTGIIVNEVTNVPRAAIRALRGILFAWRKFGRRRAAHHYYRKRGLRYRGGKAFQMSIEGQIAYIGQVRGKDCRLFASLSRQYRDLVSPALTS